MTLVSPVGTGLTQGRTDQGVDYSGSGPLYAVGSGTILSISNAGWPGGTFIALALDNPPDALHKIVYYAEDITPAVAVGDRVTAGQQLGQATGGTNGIEIGWGSPSAIGRSLQTDFGPYAGSGATEQGQDFLNAISGATATLTGTNATLVFNPLDPLGIGGVAGEFSKVASKLSSFQFWLRVGEFALGLGLLVGGLALFVATSKEGEKAIGTAAEIAPLLAA
jgi:murein DD-endopeptidase MepM/ murein hydrolase activator NlpD